MASHISGAAPGGPRYDPTLKPKERGGFSNGIWLCQNCAKLIDSDENRYNLPLLAGWKKSGESFADARIGRPISNVRKMSGERELQRVLKLRSDMRLDFFKLQEAIGKMRSVRGSGAIERPYDLLLHGEVIIHPVQNDFYPDNAHSPKRFCWFKTELYDFYHNGLRTIHCLENGVIERGFKQPWLKHWAFNPFGTNFDETRFESVKIWTLDLIPFHEIRKYDLLGDEHYNIPHIYCSFSINGKPFEKREYVTCGVAGEPNWPLESSLQLRPEEIRSQGR